MTDSVPVRAPRSPLFELWQRVQRERALVALFDLGRKKTYGLRAARLYAFGVFVSYAVAIAITRGAEQRATIQGFFHEALRALSWVVGALAALGSTQALARPDDRDGLTMLAAQHGFGPSAQLRARALAAAWRITSLVGTPALLLIGVALARGNSVAWALWTAPAIAIYASALGLALAALALFAAELSPRHPRALLLALLLGPLLLTQVSKNVPNFPQLFGILLDRLLSVGVPVS